MKPIFIAEVSSNHHQSLERCLEFVDVAASIGCDAVKFQLFKIDQLFAPEILAISETHQRRKAWELPLAFVPEIAARCREKKIAFGCTPFYLDAIDELDAHVDFFKIASYELLWHPLISACSATGKPLIISTGMATLDEIDQAVKAAHAAGKSPLTLLHCVSAYPTPADQCNLAVIDQLHKRYKCEAGWSDHSVSAGVINRAIHCWGASVIEFHLDLEGDGEEYSAGHCWLPEQIGAVISNIREGFSADGVGDKQPTEAERSDRQWRADPEDGLRPLKGIRSTWQA